MASLFHHRVLSNLYSSSDVVLESSASKTVDGFLKLRVAVGFGIHGKVTRHQTIKLSAVNMLSVTQELKKHEDNILELIDLLEQSCDWAQSRFEAWQRTDGEDNRSNKTFTLYQESPLMFHCVQERRRACVRIYGEGLNNMELMLDCKEPSKLHMFKARMNEILAHFRNHLFDIEQANFKEIMEGVTA